MFRIVLDRVSPPLHGFISLFFAKMTEGLSGSDIGNLVDEALMVPINKVIESKYWQKVSISSVFDGAVRRGRN
jgi:hypothetical protein